MVFGALAPSALFAGLIAGLIALVASPAAADEPARSRMQVERIVLALDGTPVAVSAGDVITFEGTLSSTHDGSEIDAFSRRTDTLEFVDAGPFVDVPEGSELIEADRAAHRYVVRVGQDGVVAFAVQRLAMRQLVTRSEAVSRLRGALELARPIAVVVPVPPEMALASAASAEDAGTPWWPIGALIALGAAIGIPLSRRRDGFAPLLRRARRAHSAVAQEAKRLGPVFEPVTDSANHLVDSLSSLREHAKEANAARARIRGAGPEAAARRLALAGEAADSVQRATQIVDRLEGVAAHMAAAVADHARATGVDEALSLVNADLGLALDADDTARALC